MNVNELKKYMEKNNIKNIELINALGMDESTFYRKLQTCGDTFYVKEMNKIIRFTKMSKEKAAEIFFGEKLA
ncbi:MAG: XRE family transcriptional regulator [Anaerovoracaceae bacterium]